LGKRASVTRTVEAKMAAVSEDQIRIEPDNGTVEKRVVVREVKDRTAPYALAITVLFVLTCVIVFFGERLGLRSAQTTTPAATDHLAQ
jgi:hypothetical protein